MTEDSSQNIAQNMEEVAPSNVVPVIPETTPQRDNDEASSKSLPDFWKRFWSKVWWRNAIRLTLGFSRHCVVAASIWTLAGTVMVIGVWQSAVRVGGGGTLTIESYLASTTIFLSAIATTFILMAWSLGVWLVKVTAFARAFGMLPVYSPTLDLRQSAQVQLDAIEYSWQRKAFVAKFWFFISVVMAPGMFVLALLIAARTLPLISPQLGGQVPITISKEMELVLGVLIVIQSALLTEISMVSLVVSAHTTQDAFIAARSALVLSAKNFLPAILLTLGVMALNVLISTPQILFRLNNPGALFVSQDNIPRILFENFWQGLTSVVLWTFATAPISELLRDKVK